MHKCQNIFLKNQDIYLLKILHIQFINTPFSLLYILHILLTDSRILL